MIDRRRAGNMLRRTVLAIAEPRTTTLAVANMDRYHLADSVLLVGDMDLVAIATRGYTNRAWDWTLNFDRLATRGYIAQL